MSVSLGQHILSDVELWWPHTHGTPSLYPVHATFEIEHGLISHELYWMAGIRHVNTWVDPTTQGRIFEINGLVVFIEGGNWITTDQFLRHASNPLRYYHEVRMHKEAGLNMIRVWGGGLAERPEFYHACDQLGMLVMQVRTFIFLTHRIRTFF